MKILVTGARGFIGQNLVLRLREQAGIEVLTFVRGDTYDMLRKSVDRADAVVHLAGENRPSSPLEYESVNVGLTQRLCQFLKDQGRPLSIVLASSSQAVLNNPYGKSKAAAEAAVEELVGVNGHAVAIYRLPGVFGKWCKPNYNSVVATFCHLKARDLPVQISDAEFRLRLVYIDDVVSSMLHVLQHPERGLVRPTIKPEYQITLGELCHQLDAFKNCRTTLRAEPVGEGLVRALYATYVSYLPPEKFSYELLKHSDKRGMFVEMLKTPESGQFSFFTSHPGITRGGHYHHTKTEKFLVIKGQARFCFRHMLTDEMYSLNTHGDHPQIVETVPGWAHEVTNVGPDELVVMLWANEIFDPQNTDTMSSRVEK